MCKSYTYKHIKICCLEFHMYVCMYVRVCGVCVCVVGQTGEIGILYKLNGYDVMEKVYAHVCALQR